MPKAVKVKKGAGYLPEHNSADLECMRGMLPPGKPRLRVQTAILRKKGKSVEKIGTALGENPSTVHNWLLRLAEGTSGMPPTGSFSNYMNRRFSCKLG